MATIKDIAKVLVEKHKMKVGVSEEFLQNIVEVINEGLLQDRIVKIKGFGTFKLQEVKERKSVNVNTGESVVIAAHDRITFTPDSVMRDLVNKPFAQFETVIVDNDKKTETASPASAALMETEEPKVEEPKKEEPKVETPKKEEPKVETPKKEEPKVETPKKVEPKKEEPKPEKIEEQKVEKPAVAEETTDEEPAPNRKWLYILIGAVVAIACFALGYYASHNDMFKKSEAPAEQIEQVQKQDSVAVTDTIAPQKKAEPADDFEKYNKDGRVKYGAYIIVGTDTTVTVRKGQTLRGISKAYLGPDMECYVEAYNETKEVKEGDKVRIPKLKVKKKKK